MLSGLHRSVRDTEAPLVYRHVRVGGRKTQEAIPTSVRLEFCCVACMNYFAPREEPFVLEPSRMRPVR